MIFGRVTSKLKAAREVRYGASPALPLIRDSVRMQFSEYDVKHHASGLSFTLRPNCGDWFTFYECCIRQDYFPKAVRIQPGDRVLDIGGNFGAFTLMAAKKVGPEGIVHCYEPSPDSFARICSHMKRNGCQNAHIRQCAVGGESGQILLYQHRKSALSSTMKIIDGRIMEESTPIIVDVISISEVIIQLKGEIALAKIDCEGSEYEIMDMIEDTELARIRTIVMETHAVPGKSIDAIFEKLRDNDFEIWPGNPFIAINRSSM